MNKAKPAVVFALISLFLSLPGLSATAQEWGEGQGFLSGTSSTKQLERLSSLKPDNYAIRYYLGLSYLRSGDLDSAIPQWEKYLTLAPDDSKAVSVREQLTLLKIRQARDFAKAAVKKDSGGGDARSLEANTVAVLNFRNLASPALIPFIKGLTAMVITDLTEIPDLKIVERVKIQALMDEMRLGRVGLVDSETASKTGRLLLAKNIAWGEVDAPPGVGDDISVVSIVSETLSHKELGKTMLSRPKHEFFKLEKEIVTGIVNMLGLKKEDLAPSVAKSLQRIHTTNLEAFMYYGKGLDLLDQMKYDSAKEAFQKAFKLDPEFGLANEAYKFAPSSAVNAADLGLESRDIKTFETGATGNLIDTDITTKVIDVKQELKKCP